MCGDAGVFFLERSFIADQEEKLAWFKPRVIWENEFNAARERKTVQVQRARAGVLEFENSRSSLAH